MRRTLEVISLGIFLLGLELATGTPSLTIARLQETVAYPLGSDPGENVEWAALGGLILIGFAVILASFAILVRLRKKKIQDHDACATCGGKTKRVRRNVWHRMLGRVLGKALAARHCGECGWRGVSYLG